MDLISKAKVVKFTAACVLSAVVGFQAPKSGNHNDKPLASPGQQTRQVVPHAHLQHANP